MQKMTENQQPESPWTEKEGLLLYKGLIYVSVSSDIFLKLDLVSMYHDSLLAGYQGISKMHELLSRNYYFPNMKAFIIEYVGSCDLCARTKASRYQKHGELALLPVLNSLWIGIPCDFVT